MKTETPAQKYQKKFNFSAPQPRPFLANLPARIDTYEEGVARFFQWRTGLDYYLAIDQIVDFVVDTRRVKVIDLLADTACFPSGWRGRKAFPGRIYSFDNNITLLERAKQRAAIYSRVSSSDTSRNLNILFRMVTEISCSFHFRSSPSSRRTAPGRDIADSCPGWIFDNSRVVGAEIGLASRGTMVEEVAFAVCAEKSPKPERYIMIGMKSSKCFSGWDSGKSLSRV